MRKAMSVVTAAALGVGVWTGVAQAQADASRLVKRAGVSLRLASTSPVNGFEAASVGGERMFVAPKGGLSGADVTSATAIDVRDGRDVELTLTRDAAEKLAGSLRETGATRLAVYENGELLASGAVIVDTAVARATVRGLTAANADRLVRLVDVRVVPSGPAVRMVLSQEAIQAGGTVSADLFVDGAITSLRGYQFVMRTEGGEAGSLSLQDGKVNATRPDYVFGSEQKLEGVDREGMRMMAALMTGGVDVSRPSYLGTLTFQASPDAQGSFRIVMSAEVGDSVLLNANNQNIAFTMPEPAQLTVGQTSRLTPTRR